ncbi:hypothetical protein GCM10027033_14150 [Leucobacter ruminantium]
MAFQYMEVGSAYPDRVDSEECLTLAGPRPVHLIETGFVIGSVVSEGAQMAQLLNEINIIGVSPAFSSCLSRGEGARISRNYYM